MADRARRRTAEILVAIGLVIWLTGMALPTVEAASSWWVSAPGPTRILSAVSSNSTYTTLAVSHGVAGWLNVTTGAFSATRADHGAEFVAADASWGVILESGGALYLTHLGGRTRLLQQLPGAPRGLAVSRGPRPVVAAATSAGIYQGSLGSSLRRLGAQFSAPGPLALAGPVTQDEPFVVATAGGVLFLSKTGELRRSRGAPQLGIHAALAELGDGIILAGDYRGLISALYPGGWTPIFQILPYGGLGGVPHLNQMVGVGPDAAYVATSGFGTLLTPDGGYSWYRAAPPTASGRVLALATLGPIYSSRPSGLVVAASPSGAFVHRLQLLPAPVVYSGAGQAAQLLGTALVTAAAAIAVIGLMWVIRRRQRRRLFV